MVRLNRNRLAGQADRHYLYQESVQDTEAEIDFFEETWAALRDRPAELLREDFCGTANTACEWIRRDPQHYAIGVDLDPLATAAARDNAVANGLAGRAHFVLGPVAAGAIYDWHHPGPFLLSGLLLLIALATAIRLPKPAPREDPQA